MKIEELEKGKVYYFTYDNSEYHKYNYIGKYKSDYTFSSYVQPEIKNFSGGGVGTGRWGGRVVAGVYRPATLDEITHLEQCVLENKYVDYKKEIIKSKYEKEDGTMNNIEKVLEKIYTNDELRKTCIPLFLGNPGLGKTKVIEKFAKEKEAQLVEVIASQLMPHEISGMSLPLHEERKMTYFDFDRFCSLKDGDILFFDELLNANPMVLNACLTLLENRTMISGRKLPNIMIVAAANQQGSTILTPQIKERFIFYDVTFSPSLWGKYMYEKYNIVDEVLEDLVTLIKNEKFESSRYNYLTPRSIDKAISMILREVRTPYEKEISPILEKLITNTTDYDLVIDEENKWLKGEKISWLKLTKQMYKQNNNDKINSKPQTEASFSLSD